MKNLESLSCNITLRAGGQSISNAVSISFIGCNTFDTNQELLLFGTATHMHVTRSVRPPPPYLVIKYWRWEQSGNESEL